MGIVVLEMPLLMQGHFCNNFTEKFVKNDKTELG